MTNKELRNKLLALADPKLLAFQNKLGINSLPGLGIKIPVLRSLAKEIADNDYESFLLEPYNDYFEEVIIEGMVIGYIPSFKEAKKYIDRFIPKISDWAICDSFCGSLKVANKEPKVVWDYLSDYLKSDKEFILRFCLVMYLSYFLKDEYISKVLDITDHIKSDYYYVKMAQAWLISIAYIKYPILTLAYLKKSHLDDWTFNKSIQKIKESLRVSKEDKIMLNKLKR